NSQAATAAAADSSEFRRKIDANGSRGGGGQRHYGRAQWQRHRARPEPAARDHSARRRTHPRTVLPMILSEILSGVRLLEPLPPELAALPIEGLDFDSRRVGAGF